MRATKSEGLTIKPATFTEREGAKVYTYSGFALRGWLSGKRVRKQFKTKSEALTAKERLEIEAADASGEVRAVVTRLLPAQVKTAETMFALTPDPLAAVQWYLANYRPPLISVAVEVATAEFMRDREGEVSMPVVVDYRKVVKLLLKAFPAHLMDTITTEELETVMGSWGQSKKSWNNLRTYPISEHPLVVRNAMDHVGLVRKKFGLTDDVCRHTFISMHVAKFKSLGATALEAGNSEAIIKKHYLNRVTDAVAEAFWAVVPQVTEEMKPAA